MLLNFCAFPQCCVLFGSSIFAKDKIKIKRALLYLQRTKMRAREFSRKKAKSSSPKNVYEIGERLVLAADCMVVQAAIHLHNKSLIGEMRAAFLIRKACKFYLHAGEVIFPLNAKFPTPTHPDALTQRLKAELETDLPSPSKIEQLVAMVNFGFGLIQFVLATTPPRFVSITPWFGYPDEEESLRYLRQCAAVPNLKSPLALLFLLWHQLQILPRHVEGREQLREVLHEGRTLIDTFKDRYPESCFYGYFLGRYNFLSGEFHPANKAWTAAANKCAGQLPEIVMLSNFDQAWIHVIRMEFEKAYLLFHRICRETMVNRCANAYLAALCAAAGAAQKEDSCDSRKLTEVAAYLLLECRRSGADTHSFSFMSSRVQNLLRTRVPSYEATLALFEMAYLKGILFFPKPDSLRAMIASQETSPFRTGVVYADPYAFIEWEAIRSLILSAIHNILGDHASAKSVIDDFFHIRTQYQHQQQPYSYVYAFIKLESIRALQGVHRSRSAMNLLEADDSESEWPSLNLFGSILPDAENQEEAIPTQRRHDDSIVDDEIAMIERAAEGGNDEEGSVSIPKPPAIFSSDEDALLYSSDEKASTSPHHKIAKKTSMLKRISRAVGGSLSSSPMAPRRRREPSPWYQQRYDLRVNALRKTLAVQIAKLHEEQAAKERLDEARRFNQRPRELGRSLSAPAKPGGQHSPVKGLLLLPAHQVTIQEDYTNQPDDGYDRNDEVEEEEEWYICPCGCGEWVPLYDYQRVLQWQQETYRARMMMMQYQQGQTVNYRQPSSSSNPMNPRRRLPGPISWLRRKFSRKNSRLDSRVAKQPENADIAQQQRLRGSLGSDDEASIQGGSPTGVPAAKERDDEQQPHCSYVQ